MSKSYMSNSDLFSAMEVVLNDWARGSHLADPKDAPCAQFGIKGEQFRISLFEDRREAPELIKLHSGLSIVEIMINASISTDKKKMRKTILRALSYISEFKRNHDSDLLNAANKSSVLHTLSDNVWSRGSYGDVAKKAHGDLIDKSLVKVEHVVKMTVGSHTVVVIDKNGTRSKADLEQEALVKLSRIVKEEQVAIVADHSNYPRLRKYTGQGECLSLVFHSHIAPVDSVIYRKHVAMVVRKNMALTLYNRV